MNHNGLVFCARYGYPPNSLSLCGPEKQLDLSWYTSSLTSDKGTVEILKQFSTLYPYLVLIAQANNISDPFDPRVVEAYWLGNTLLHSLAPSLITKHFEDTLHMKKLMGSKQLNSVYEKLQDSVMPHHSFHVLNLYRRTGHTADTHTVQTMDACIINYGTITDIAKDVLLVKTRPLQETVQGLNFGASVIRKIKAAGAMDSIYSSLVVGDTISYHWGMLCSKLTYSQKNNLIKYTKFSMKVANTHIYNPHYVFS